MEPEKLQTPQESASSTSTYGSFTVPRIIYKSKGTTGQAQSNSATSLGKAPTSTSQLSLLPQVNDLPIAGMALSDHPNRRDFIQSFVRNIPKKILLILGSASVVLILCLVVVAVLFYQNTKADDLFKSAKADIAQGKYSLASSLLDRASKYYALPTNHKRISQLTAQNKVWIADDSYLQQATVLVQKQDFSSATTLLSKISPSFPSYSKVNTQKKLIASEQAAIAAKEAAAVAAANTAEAAQAAAAQAAAEKAETAQAASKSGVKTSGESTGSTSSSYTVANTAVYSAYGVNYYYAEGAQDISGANGVSVNLSQANPTVPSGDHSLIELAGAFDNNYDFVEIGWMVDQSQFGDTNTHLFISRWIGMNNQCYAPASGCGFVQVSSTNTPNETISSSGTGNFEINFVNNDWYVYYNGDVVGYFPESIWGAGHNQLKVINIYGEVELQTNSTTCVPMGNGIAGTSPGSAQVSGYSLIGSSTAASFSSFEQTSNSGYSVGAPTSTSFRLGGPGAC